MEQREPGKAVELGGSAKVGEPVTEETSVASSAPNARESLAPSSADAAAVSASPTSGGGVAKVKPADPFVRAENEDDDGYDPYSDRPAPREPMFERDPWG